ncbi:hypothetical protein [Naasia sp. SYSU D00057]|uniref:hypothetical protein n=1 Tax=Naasia sp. SYSU D00057 TaxID=2817380 RepID=UPI001B315D80|nr:hypothetical protein [Naasia sp. SYSU D00057]
MSVRVRQALFFGGAGLLAVCLGVSLLAGGTLETRDAIAATVVVVIGAGVAVFGLIQGIRALSDRR